MELISINIENAENGCVVSCSHKDENGNYVSKKYIAEKDFMEKIMENFGDDMDEVEEEKSSVPREKGKVTKIYS